jgi:transposase-like protein
MLTEFSSIIELIQKFPTEQHCIEHLEAIRWNGNVVSPFAENSKVYKCAGNKYKCKETGKYFNVRTATIFEDTKMPLQKWFMALYLFSSHKKGISSHQLAKDLDITQKSAWFVLHRLRYAFNHPAFKAQLGNVVEADETFIGGKEANKHADKKIEGAQGRNVKGKMPIVGMVERGGNVIAQHITDIQGDTIQSVVKTNVVKGAHLMTDEWNAYQGLRGYYVHRYIKHSAKQYVNGMVHTNTIEGFWSQLKRGIDGIYHWVSFKHLQSYVNEYSLRYNSRKINENNRFNLVLANMVGRLTYKELTS